MDMVTTADGNLDGITLNQPVQKILCAVGLEDAGVLRIAADLSRRWQAELHVIHVVPEIHEGTLATSAIGRQALSEGTALQFLEDLKVAAGTEEGPVTARSIVRTGRVQQTVEQEAKALGADVLVTGRKRTAVKQARSKRPIIRWDWILAALGFDPVSAGW